MVDDGQGVGAETVGSDGARAKAHRPRYVVLDAFRGLAALALAIFHLQVFSHLYVLPVVRNAYLFVDFFFLLSGFVISHAYAGRIADVGALTVFVTRRFGRLYPLHLSVLAAFVATELLLLIGSHRLGLALPRAPFSHDRTAPAILVNVLLLNGIGLTPGATWNGPSWSISAEFFVYLLFGATMLLPAKRQGVAAAFMACLALAVLAAFSPGFEVCNRFALFRCIASFFLGTFVWRVRHAFALPCATPIEIMVLVVVLLFVWFAASGPLQLLAPVPFGLALYVFSQERGLVSRAMRHPALQRLGALSYSVYMVHYFFAFALSNVIKMLGQVTHLGFVAAGTDLVLVGNAWVMDAVTMLYLAVVVLAAQGVHAGIERPGMRLFNGLVASRRVRRHGGPPRSADRLLDGGG